MSYDVQATTQFSKQIKRLKKKYPSLEKEYFALIKQLKDDPTIGVSIGQNCYKIRVAIASKGKGKSGGARAIYYVQVSDKLVLLLTIYDKSEQEDISDQELQKLLDRFIEH